MIRTIIILFLVAFYSKNVFAVSLSEALLQAYKNNPELNAERENIEVSKQDLKISKSEFLPSVILSGSKSQEDTEKLTNQSGGNASIALYNIICSVFKSFVSAKTKPILFFSKSAIPPNP